MEKNTAAQMFEFLGGFDFKRINEATSFKESKKMNILSFAFRQPKKVKANFCKLRLQKNGLFEIKLFNSKQFIKRKRNIDSGNIQAIWKKLTGNNCTIEMLIKNIKP